MSQVPLYVPRSLTVHRGAFRRGRIDAQISPSCLQIPRRKQTESVAFLQESTTKNHRFERALRFFSGAVLGHSEALLGWNDAYHSTDENYALENFWNLKDLTVHDVKPISDE